MSKKVTLRNEETQAGKEMWRAVDKAASRAPDWIKARMATVTVGRAEKARKQDGR